MDHVPQSVAYPIIAVYHISSNNTMSMPTSTVPNGFDYCNAKFQFSIYGNDTQHVQIEDIADRLETIFHRTSLTLDAGYTHICTYTTDSSTKFWDEGQKVWHIRQDYLIMAGK